MKRRIVSLCFVALLATGSANAATLDDAPSASPKNSSVQFLDMHVSLCGTMISAGELNTRIKEVVERFAIPRAKSAGLQDGKYIPNCIFDVSTSNMKDSGDTKSWITYATYNDSKYIASVNASMESLVFVNITTERVNSHKKKESATRTYIVLPNGTVGLYNGTIWETICFLSSKDSIMFTFASASNPEIATLKTEVQQALQFAVDHSFCRNGATSTKK